mmetsp:Transcript_9836/g.24543  ORF Transcript_9836/g.24543 Transcript_9836/m.24543 type:complete len:240 (-) Transcript_9836:375-1094(-)
MFTGCGTRRARRRSARCSRTWRSSSGTLARRTWPSAPRSRACRSARPSSWATTTAGTAPPSGEKARGVSGAWRNSLSCWGKSTLASRRTASRTWASPWSAAGPSPPVGPIGSASPDSTTKCTGCGTSATARCRLWPTRLLNLLTTTSSSSRTTARRALAPARTAPAGWTSGRRKGTLGIRTWRRRSHRAFRRAGEFRWRCLGTCTRSCTGAPSRGRSGACFTSTRRPEWPTSTAQSCLG